MKIGSHLHPRGSQRGIATVIVLVVFTVVLLLVLGNTVALHHLKREIQRVEKVQLEKFESPRAVLPGAPVDRERADTKREPGVEN